MQDTRFVPSEAAARIRGAFDQGKLEQAVRDRRVELLPGLLKGLAEPLFAIKQLEQLLARRMIVAEDLRIYEGRSIVDPTRIGLRQGARINLETLARLAGEGVTLLFNNLDRRLPALGALAAAMTDWLGEEIEVSCVLTFGDTSGLNRHHDPVNVLIVQLEGAKEWTFFGDPVALGSKVDAIQEEGAERQLTLHPGDVMFVPAGQPHQCTAGGYSAHLGILIHHSSAADLGAMLVTAIDSDPTLRTPLLDFLGDADIEARVAACRIRLHELVDQLDIRGSVESRRKERRLASDFSLRDSAPESAAR